MGDRDYFQPTDFVERRLSMARILMFVLVAANGIMILWESTLFRASLLGGALAHYLRLFPLEVVHHFHFWQFLTYWLVEANVWSVVFDAITLWWLGHLVEELFGTRKFAVLWCGGILLPAIFFVALGYALFPEMGYFSPGGAMLAVIVAAALQWPDMGVIFVFVPMKLKWLAVIITVMELAQGLQTLGPSYWATLVGAAWGFVFWRYHGRVSSVLARWDATAERRASVARTADEREDAAEVDRILDKIGKEGLGSLTSAERKILDRASRNRRGA
jgi:membrane associated rhomboid family serine protease